MRSHSIAVFDSGLGGLCVLREVRRLLPAEDLLYLADQVHLPYGPRDAEELRRFAEAASRFLLDRGAKLIVVACNTASAAALSRLREVFPGVPFVGMEPAIKPAVGLSRTGTVCVVATPATLRGQLFASTVERYAAGARVITRTCPGLVEAIEGGGPDSPDVEAILSEALAGPLAHGADVVVLGCTHYPLALPAIRAICGPDVRVVDPSPAVALQVRRVLAGRDLLNPAGLGRLHLFTTGSGQNLELRAREILGETGQVERLRWSRGDTALEALEP